MQVYVRGIFSIFQTMTFQAVVISDHSTSETYVQYNYKECGTWTPGFDNAIFTFARLRSDWWSLWSDYILNKWILSGSPQAVGMANIPGNTGRITLPIIRGVNIVILESLSGH